MRAFGHACGGQGRTADVPYSSLPYILVTAAEAHHFGQTARLCPSSAGVTGTGRQAQLLTCVCELPSQVLMSTKHPLWINTHWACLPFLLFSGSLTLPNGLNFLSVLSSLLTSLPQAGRSLCFMDGLHYSPGLVILECSPHDLPQPHFPPYFSTILSL